MVRRKRSKRTDHPDGRAGGRRFKLLLMVPAIVIAGIGAVVLFGPGWLAGGARHLAARWVAVGAITPAQQWLVWSAWVAPDDGRTDLMRAVCFRHLRQVDRFITAIESAERKGAPAAQIQQERELALIQAGKMDPDNVHQMGALIEAGFAPDEVAAAFVYGFLFREQPQEAKKVLDAWAADRPRDANVAYMTGIYRRMLDEPAQAATEFQNAIAWQPSHELARLALAELFEDEDRLQESLDQYTAVVDRFPASEIALVRRARTLRKLGRTAEAHALLEPLAVTPASTSPAAIEMAEIELDSAGYQSVPRWFTKAEFDYPADRDALSVSLATALALDGEAVRAERLFAQVDAANRRRFGVEDLQNRLAADGNDRQAAAELRRLAESTPADSPRADGAAAAEIKRILSQIPAASGPEMYAQHCSACHGQNGEGNGRAARHLYPGARDLRTDRFRLVSTEGGVPSLKDVESVIERGMPGTAMRSFANLPEDQRRKLAEEVLRLRREGIAEQFIAAMKAEGEEIDDDEVREVVELGATPGAAVPLPPIGPGGPQAVARSKDSYFKLGCDKCHGQDGTGAWDMALFDERGQPSAPRDLVNEPLKGGEEPESIYLRILLGMPGTPHPSCPNVPEDQLVDLVHYCQSLQREPKPTLTNYERAKQADRRAYLAAFGEGKQQKETATTN